MTHNNVVRQLASGRLRTSSTELRWRLKTIETPKRMMVHEAVSSIADTAADSGLVLNRIPSQSFRGRVLTERSLRKIDAIDSSTDNGNPKSALAASRGASSGKVIVRNTVLGPAPRLVAARESAGSIKLYAAESTR